MNLYIIKEEYKEEGGVKTPIINGSVVPIYPELKLYFNNQNINNIEKIRFYFYKTDEYYHLNPQLQISLQESEELDNIVIDKTLLTNTIYTDTYDIGLSPKFYYEEEKIKVKIFFNVLKPLQINENGFYTLPADGNVLDYNIDNTILMDVILFKDIIIKK